MTKRDTRKQGVCVACAGPTYRRNNRVCSRCRPQKWRFVCILCNELRKPGETTAYCWKCSLAMTSSQDGERIPTWQRPFGGVFPAAHLARLQERAAARQPLFERGAS